jgi:hypothetical protein
VKTNIISAPFILWDSCLLWTILTICLFILIWWNLFRRIVIVHPLPWKSPVRLLTSTHAFCLVHRQTKVKHCSLHFFPFVPCHHFDACYHQIFNIMATASRKTSCFTCGKEKGEVRCEGCSKMFCLNDFATHRQELNKQLEEAEVTRDLFRQTLTDIKAEPRTHLLIEHIDKWESQSIIKVWKAAEETRQILLKYIAGIYAELEERLAKLTNQLRQSRQESDFFETDLNIWKEELAEMKKKLTRPSGVEIRQDSIPLVTKINVDIPGNLFLIGIYVSIFFDCKVFKSHFKTNTCWKLNSTQVELLSRSSSVSYCDDLRI